MKAKYAFGKWPELSNPHRQACWDQLLTPNSKTVIISLRANVHMLTLLNSLINFLSKKHFPHTFIQELTYQLDE
jgi:hypothetical protein